MVCGALDHDFTGGVEERVHRDGWGVDWALVVMVKVLSRYFLDDNGML